MTIAELGEEMKDGSVFVLVFVFGVSFCKGNEKGRNNEPRKR